MQQFRDGFEAGYRRGHRAACEAAAHEVRSASEQLAGAFIHGGSLRTAYLDELEQRETRRQSEPDRGEPS